MEEKEQDVNIGGLLDSQIVEALTNLSTLNQADRAEAVNAIERLYKLRIEESKVVNDYFNNETKLNVEREMKAQQLESERRIHCEKMVLENDRLAMEKEAQRKTVETNQEQAKIESQKMWMEIACRSGAVLAWLLMSYKIINVEQTGVIRSKAFTGVLPKLKFW